MEPEPAAALQPLGSGKGGGVTLFDLLDAGLLAAGRGNLSVSYKGVGYAADLAADGSILYLGGCG